MSDGLHYEAVISTGEEMLAFLNSLSEEDLKKQILVHCEAKEFPGEDFEFKTIVEVDCDFYEINAIIEGNYICLECFEED